MRMNRKTRRCRKGQILKLSYFFDFPFVVRFLDNLADRVDFIGWKILEYCLGRLLKTPVVEDDPSLVAQAVVFVQDGAVSGLHSCLASGLCHSGQGARGPSLDALNREPVEANNADPDFRRATDHQLTILRLSTDLVLLAPSLIAEGTRQETISRSGSQERILKRPERGSAPA